MTTTTTEATSVRYALDEARTAAETASIKAWADGDQELAVHHCDTAADLAAQIDRFDSAVMDVLTLGSLTYAHQYTRTTEEWLDLCRELIVRAEDLARAVGVHEALTADN